MGVFIYEAEGDIPDTLRVKGIDVIPMAKGSKTEVGYVTTPELIDTLCNLGYEEMKRGLIHSHNTMPTAFSGTDVDVLEDLAENQPYYLSVVVNNKLEVTAKIAYKVREKVQTFFRNIKNEEIHINEESERISYKLHELDVKIKAPQYLMRVLPSFENMQDYDKAAYDNFEKTGKHEKPVYAGNGYAGYGGYGYQSPQQQSKVPVQVNAGKDQKQLTMFDGIAVENELSEEELADMIPSVLDDLIGMYESIPELCSAILIDKDGTGFHISEFVQFLETFQYEAVGKDKGFADRLLNTLKSYMPRLVE